MDHGGPWTRDWWGFDLSVQLWANRGYAVLQTNFRGSTEFGRAHTEAAAGEFAGRMHDDLIDAVDWAVEQGYADPDRVAIFGGSYGGYATLVGVTFTRRSSPGPSSRSGSRTWRTSCGPCRSSPWSGRRPLPGTAPGSAPRPHRPIRQL
jgi:dipeptidyl aminopeptidase/acylaminoacyl peptidase